MYCARPGLTDEDASMYACNAPQGSSQAISCSDELNCRNKRHISYSLLKQCSQTGAIKYTRRCCWVYQFFLVGSLIVDMG